jgi:hypothetical protein
MQNSLGVGHRNRAYFSSIQNWTIDLQMLTHCSSFDEVLDSVGIPDMGELRSTTTWNGMRKWKRGRGLERVMTLLRGGHPIRAFYSCLLPNLEFFLDLVTETCWNLLQNQAKKWAEKLNRHHHWQNKSKNVRRDVIVIAWEVSSPRVYISINLIHSRSRTLAITQTKRKSVAKLVMTTTNKCWKQSRDSRIHPKFVLDTFQVMLSSLWPSFGR